nr:NUDIX hydrolase [Arthrobacter dokdonellae]
MEPDESAGEAAVREAHEELGVVIARKDLVAHHDAWRPTDGPGQRRPRVVAHERCNAPS